MEILHVDEDLNAVFVWDGTDAPPVSILAKLDQSCVGIIYSRETLRIDNFASVFGQISGLDLEIKLVVGWGSARSPGLVEEGLVVLGFKWFGFRICWFPPSLGSGFKSELFPFLRPWRFSWLHVSREMERSPLVYQYRRRRLRNRKTKPNQSGTDMVKDQNKSALDKNKATAT
ncbi:unnamed protein product [Arabis nemorensis]|uniref:Uncharacterized protein n=1 Tax=Arabis nemorensis TaxID=586526 RepID=A0A565B8I2_9BRAS|nr:unnamed protein product [Arabis nemorensis]